MRDICPVCFYFVHTSNGSCWAGTNVPSLFNFGACTTLAKHLPGGCEMYLRLCKVLFIAHIIISPRLLPLQIQYDATQQQLKEVPCEKTRRSRVFSVCESVVVVQQNHPLTLSTV
jgi:hypothetical protein